jgi:hypothetical protein
MNEHRGVNWHATDQEIEEFQVMFGSDLPYREAMEAVQGLANYQLSEADLRTRCSRASSRREPAGCLRLESRHEPIRTRFVPVTRSARPPCFLRTMLGLEFSSCREQPQRRCHTHSGAEGFFLVRLSSDRGNARGIAHHRWPVSSHS